MNRGLIEASVFGMSRSPILVELPRFMNRGLIEARGGTRRTRTSLRLPRFMNRGLIEAIHSRPAIARGVHFPDS